MLSFRQFPRKGSPPRGRGKAQKQERDRLAARITPAWAGKRTERNDHEETERDHPRVGGEKFPSDASRRHTWGSPPRGRGKASTTSVPQSKTGITPAWAGKRSEKLSECSPYWDHPRVGGEKQKKTGKACKGIGSPPRGRGKGLKEKKKSTERRITPAWAGKSCLEQCQECIDEDHPRVGGEKCGVIGAALAVLGSPPRGRGKD